MLRRVAFTELPRDPQAVRLLHHTRGGVVIAAVAYRTTHAAPAAAPVFFTVVEMPAPNERGLPLRVVHVRVPRPATAVQAISFVRSPDGSDVFVVVQAAEASAHTPGAPPKSVATYVYRRQLVAAMRRGEGNEENDDSDAVSAAANVDEGDAGSEEVRVRYQRLPRTVAGADGPLWTAAASFSAGEAPIFGSPSTNGDALAFLTASSTTADGETSEAAETQLQLWGLSGTRVSLVATCRMPALAGFAVAQLLTVPGTQDVAVLRCHNALMEVDLAGIRRACQRHPHTVTTNALLTRVWRLSPHASLTACAMKDGMLYAATEDGRVLLWDYRTAAASSTTPPQSSGSVTAPITGLYAPYATGFLSCDAGGAVRDWRDRAELTDEEARESSATRVGAAAAHDEEEGEDAKDTQGGVLRDLASQAAAAAATASLFPYCSCAPVELPGGEEGCVAMDGHDNFAAVVGESGRLSVYFCS